MTRNLILCGGIFHEFHASSDELARVLSQLGIESVVEDDIAVDGECAALANAGREVRSVSR
jgi:hypothetical protein